MLGRSLRRGVAARGEAGDRTLQQRGWVFLGGSRARRSYLTILCA